ncbi:hypothetical protein [Pandoraea anhela]|uniref:YD repeat-containing protein n=1 Tax=Pandoraea anhela TaxID=2508295 RepID=A0A5E4SZP5_9BURK|nr:hypothetical protein [Pandoraea anhela]VVD81280.1 hypothetical protein PAN31108_01115 [Pandoraea anhela]
MLSFRSVRGALALAALTAVLAGCAGTPPGVAPANPKATNAPALAPVNAATPVPSAETPQAAAAPLPWCVQAALREEDDLMRNFGGIPAGVRKIEETRFIASYDRSTGKVGPLDNGNRFVMEFDPQGHLLASTDRGRYTYDADGRLHSINGTTVDWQGPDAWVVHAARQPAWKEQVRLEDGHLEWTRSLVSASGSLHHRRPGTVQARQFDDECFALSRQWEAPNEARQVITADGRARPAPKMVSYRTFASVERKPDGGRIVRDNGAAAFIDGQWLPLAWDNEVSEYSPRHELVRVIRTDAATGEHHVSEYHYKYDSHGNIVRIVITSPGDKIDPFANVFVRKLTYFDATTGVTPNGANNTNGPLGATSAAPRAPSATAAEAPAAAAAASDASDTSATLATSATLGDTLTSAASPTALTAVTSAK